MLAVMFLVASIVFVIVRLVPGRSGGGDARTGCDRRRTSPRCASALGLDAPILSQYVRYLADAVRGDLGQSIFLGRPVLQAIAERAEPTICLTLDGDRDRDPDRPSRRHRLRGVSRQPARSGGADSRDAGRQPPGVLAGPDADPPFRRRSALVSGLRLRAARRTLPRADAFLVLPSIVLGAEQLVARHALHPRQHARRARRRLHPHRAREGPARSARRPPARARATRRSRCSPSSASRSRCCSAARS